MKIENEFIPFEQALALKELGFDEPCIRGWDKNGKIWYHPDSDIVLDNLTFSQAFRWFRKKYGLQSYINPELSFSYNNPKYTVIFIKTTKNFTTYKDDTIWVRENIERKRFNSYEEAELELLKKLIEIVKNK